MLLQARTDVEKPAGARRIVVVDGWSAARPPWQVRICRTKEGPPVGAGMLCDDSHVVTCAHVISPNAMAPTEPVFVRFEFVGHDDSIPAQVIDGGWHPEGPDDSGDVAVLKLMDPRPKEAKPAPLSDAEPLRGDPFEAYGYPKGRERGVRSRGSFVGYSGEWLQLEADRGSGGYLLQEGFSGAPIWDEQLNAIVGIIIASDTDERHRTGYGMPVAGLRRYWPELPPAVTQQPRRSWEERWPVLASRPRRVAARLIDLLVVTGLTSMTWALTAQLEASKEWMIALAAFVAAAYEPLVMLIWQVTPGKRALGLKLESLRAGPDKHLGMAQAVGRALIADLLLLLLPFNLYRFLRDPTQQCVHDAIAKTIVVRCMR